ncbi:DNA glycosylase AlkZ-like family protein [Paenibacillus dakarensis]|uniref:DNA glycosylase AlkZ-like family protein n=1 Tax=Paenibacillus dakarensis TaxID=1527293 RepID=UPI0012E31767
MSNSLKGRPSYENIRSWCYRCNWPDALTIAGIRGALCYGPNRGRKVTYISTKCHLGEFSTMDGHTALIQFVKHYLYAYGPATSQQFAKWLSAPPQWAAELSPQWPMSFNSSMLTEI